MGNQVAKRDVNRITVLLGTGSDSDAEVLRLILDPTTKRLLVDALSEEIGHDAIGTFRTIVSNPGTEVRLAANACKWCIVQALSDNTGNVAIGDASVVAAEATQQGLRLSPGQAQPFRISNTNILYVDAETGGDGVSVTYLN